MDLDGVPPGILAKHPDLVEIAAALDSYREGRPVEATCPTCHRKLSVTAIPETGELWVICGTGCTSYHSVSKK